MTAIAQYNQAAANVPDEALLGQLVWYTISSTDISYDFALKELQARGLPTSALKPIRRVDAYRLATKELEHSFPIHDQVKLNVMVRSVTQDASAVERHVVCERVNSKKGERQRLAYDPSARLVYHRGTKGEDGKLQGDRVEVIRHRPPLLEQALTAEQLQWMDDALDGLPDRFRHLSTHLGDHKVRNFVRETLKGFLAIPVRESGGVYFVAQKKADSLKSLADWVEAMGSRFHSTPLLDLVNQRAMLAQAFEDEAVKEIEQLAKEIDKILDDPNRRVEEETFDSYALQTAQLTKKANEYADLLGIRSEIAHERIQRFQKRTLDLAGRIEFKPPKE